MAPKRRFRDPLRRKFQSWRYACTLDTQQLERWLQGYDLVYYRDGEEPFQQLTRALPRRDRAARAYEAIAEKLVAYLHTKPDVRRPGRHTDRLLYNLLQMCAAVGASNQVLLQELVAMRRRDKISGEWMMDLCELLHHTIRGLQKVSA